MNDLPTHEGSVLIPEDRREKETELFVRAIQSFFTNDTKVVMEYGCGLGRISKALLKSNTDLQVIGVEESMPRIQTALAYVNDERFEAVLPGEINCQVDLIYSVFFLQHLPALEIRETLQRIYQSLKPGGLFIYCSSISRLARRFDKAEFFDDRFLGVNIKREVERFFEPIAPLFPTEIIEQEEILKRLIQGRVECDANMKLLQHPCFVCKRREIEGPLFNAPFR